MDDSIVIESNPEATQTLIPQWTIEDFLGTGPYEWLYQFKDKKFLLQQMLAKAQILAKSLRFPNFTKMWNAYVESQSPKATILGNFVTGFNNQPMQLQCGKYVCEEDSVFYINDLGARVDVISHPLMPTKRLMNIETLETKTEIAFCRGKKEKWKFLTVPRKQISSAQQIINLADHDVSVTSENAKEVIKYLSTLESINYDDLPEQDSVGHMGWLPDGRFMPYVDNVTYDGDSAEFHRMYDEFKPTGSEDEWMKIAREVRNGDSVPARIALAASFAAPLTQILGCLPFFVHFWGETGCGKTVGLMLAASVWGNPDVGRYIKTFSGTKVSMELYAAFCCNLPIMFDELQVISDRKMYDDIIYMLTEGSSKGRGAKEGGLQVQRRWASSIITTGEMPITQSNSGGGAVARTIDVNYGGIPLFKNARNVANKLKKNYGHVGPKFIKVIQGEGMNEALNSLYNKIYGDMIQEDVQDKQVVSATLLLVADILATKAIFKDNRALTFQDLKPYLASRAETDVNLRCYNWLIGYCAANPRRFVQEVAGEANDKQKVQYDSSGESNGELWGKYFDGYIYINKTIFDSLLKNNGFSPSSFIDWARRKNYLRCLYYGPGNKNNRPTWPVRVDGKQVPHMAIKLPPEENIPKDLTEQEAYKDYVQVNPPDMPF